MARSASSPCSQARRGSRPVGRLGGRCAARAQHRDGGRAVRGAASLSRRVGGAQRAARVCCRPRVVVVLYGVAAVASLGLALFRDPFLDQYCWSNCTENVFLVRPEQEVARLLREALLLAVLAGATVVVALAARRFVRAKGAARRVVLPVAISGAVLGGAQAAYAGALLRNPAESADKTVFVTLFLVRAGAATLLAVALGWSAYVVWRTRSAVAHLALELGEAPAPGSLRTALAASLGDPDVEVAYPIGASERFVDAAGNVVPAPVAGPDRVVTPIVREGRQIAVVVHSHGGRRRGGARTGHRRGRAPRGRKRAAPGRAARTAATTCGRPAPASSRPETPPGACSSATCTTAHSSGCSRSPMTCVSRVRQRRQRGKASSRRPRRRRATKHRPRSRSCASSRTGSSPRSSPRPGSGRPSGVSSTKPRSPSS